MGKSNHRAAAGAGLRRAKGTTDSGGTLGSPPADRTAPDQEQIAQLAYQLWEERGRPEDSPERDWFRAEQQLLEPTGVKRRSAAAGQETS
jgi:Protein of unknown function (DUF2934)